jgi:hypothetical protein
MLIAYALALAYPDQMNFRFPSSPTHKFMGNFQTDGVYDPDLVSANGVTCTKKGLYVVGHFDPAPTGLTAHHTYNTETSYYKYDTLASTVGSVALNGTYDVVCANKVDWSYARWDNGASDPLLAAATAIARPVLVIGHGVGGLAAAAAIALRSATSVLAVGRPGSTTAMSTGVALFPTSPRHNATHLSDHLTAWNTANATRMEDWFDTAATARDFWEPRLDLVPYEINNQKPDEYSGIAGDDAYIASTPTCNDTDCGSELVAALKALTATADDKIVSVTRYADGRFLLEGETGTTYLADVVVFGTGGNGHARYPNTTHATAENTNLALATANSLNLATDGEDRCYYLPHVTIGPTQSAEWFPTTDCVPTCGEIDICAEYQTRGLQMNTTSSCSTAEVNFNAVCANKPRGLFWRNVLSGYGIPLAVQCTAVTVQKGVIDCKGAFATDLALSATGEPRLYASGTTASAFTGDTYLAPGATIGLGLWSGHRVAQTALDRALAHAAARSVSPAYTSDAPAFFLAAVWTFLAGVTAHVAVNVWPDAYPLLGRAHYALMTIGVVLVLFGVYVAATTGEVRARAAHRSLGYALLVLLVLQAAAGWYLTTIEYTARGWYGTAHRLSGALALALVVVQYYSATAAREPLDAYADYDVAPHRDLAHAYTALLVVVLGYGFYRYARSKATKIVF